MSREEIEDEKKTDKKVEKMPSKNIGLHLQHNKMKLSIAEKTDRAFSPVLKPPAKSPDVK